MHVAGYFGRVAVHSSVEIERDRHASVCNYIPPRDFQLCFQNPQIKDLRARAVLKLMFAFHMKIRFTKD